MAARQALELFLAWAFGCRELCAVVLGENGHEHRPGVLTKIGPQIPSEEGAVSVFPSLNLATVCVGQVDRAQPCPLLPTPTSAAST